MPLAPKRARRTSNKSNKSLPLVGEDGAEGYRKLPSTQSDHPVPLNQLYFLRVAVALPNLLRLQSYT